MSTNVLPEQSGPLLVATGTSGVESTVTLTVLVIDTQPASVAYTEYIPDADVGIFGITGLADIDVKPIGPVQWKVTPGVRSVA